MSTLFILNCIVECSKNICVYNSSQIDAFLRHIPPSLIFLKHKCDDLKRLYRSFLPRENNNVDHYYLGFILLKE